MKLPISLSILALGLLAGCGDETLLEKSCGGGTVPNCLPYEYAVITAASVEPGGVTVGDPLETLDVRVAFDRCPRLERNHEVAIQLRTGGETPRIFDLVTLRDDGEGVGLFFLGLFPLPEEERGKLLREGRELDGLRGLGFLGGRFLVGLVAWRLCRGIRPGTGHAT